jgi:hypothetical protein
MIRYSDSLAYCWKQAKRDMVGIFKVLGGGLVKVVVILS